MHKALGYVNATQLCKTYQKQFKNWYANKGTKAMIEGLAAKQTAIGLSITTEHMMVTVEGGSGLQKKLFVVPMSTQHSYHTLFHGWTRILQTLQA